MGSYNVRKIAEDQYGFIWAAHQAGIDRFDGLQFEKINKLAGGGLVPDKDIRDIVFDPLRECIWALEGEEYLMQIDPLTNLIKLRIKVPKQENNDWNICFLLNENKIWIGTLSGLKIFDIVSNQFKISGSTLPVKPAEALTEVRSVIKDQFDRIWAFTSGMGYFVYAGDGTPVANFTGYTSNGIASRVWSACTIKNHILLATDHGLIQFESSLSNQPVFTHVAISGNPIKTSPAFTVASLPGGNIFVTTDHSFLVDSAFNIVSDLQDLQSEVDDWLPGVRSVYVSGAGLVWLACTKGMLQLNLHPSPIERFLYGNDKTQKVGHVYSLAASGDSLFIATENKLFQLNQGQLTKQNSRSYEYLLKVGNFGILGSAVSGTEWIKGGLQLPLPLPVKMGTFNSNILIGDSMCLLGTSNYKGIMQWHIKSGKVTVLSTQQPADSSPNVIKSLFSDVYGNVWVLSNNSLSVRLNRSQKLQPLNIPSMGPGDFNLYFDMCEAGGDYWLAVHQKGILQLNNKRQVKQWFTEKEGLCNNGVYKIFPVGDTALYITTNNGLSVFNIKKRQFQNYYASDGLHSNNFEEACGIYTNGKIYAGGINGFSIIDPLKFHPDHTGPVTFINRVTIELPDSRTDTTNFEMQGIAIPANVIQTTLHFSAINFPDAERITFVYRIKELNTQWISLGAQAFINLIGIAPGHYTLLVQSRNKYGYAGPVRGLTLEFLPKWYQSWWFKILICSLTISFLYALYVIRIKQLKKEQQIRAKLASDLHDDLGSTLNSVRVYTNLAIIEKENGLHLQKIKQNMQEAILSLRDIIWVMDDSKGTIEYLRARISQFALPLSQVSGINYIEEITEQALEYKLNAEEKRNLYMILKEAVNNSIKYSGAGEMKLAIDVVKAKPVIIFQDNGAGYNNKISGEGNGLKNMKIRAAAINFTFHIESHKGTIIHLQKH